MRRIGAYVAVVLMLWSGLVLAQEKRIGNFILYPNGTAMDIQTGLQWMTKDFRLVENRSPQSWQEAMAWADKMNAQRYGGFGDWRVPTLAEYKTIYIKGNGAKHDLWGFDIFKLDMPEVFEQKGGYEFWSSDLKSKADPKFQGEVDKYYTFEFTSNVSGSGEANYSGVDGSSNMLTVRLVRGGKVTAVPPSPVASAPPPQTPPVVARQSGEPAQSQSNLLTDDIVAFAGNADFSKANDLIISAIRKIQEIEGRDPNPQKSIQSWTPYLQEVKGELYPKAKEAHALLKALQPKTHEVQGTQRMFVESAAVFEAAMLDLMIAVASQDADLFQRILGNIEKFVLQWKAAKAKLSDLPNEAMRGSPAGKETIPPPAARQPVEEKKAEAAPPQSPEEAVVGFLQGLLGLGKSEKKAPAATPSSPAQPMAPPASRLTSDWETNFKTLHLTQEGAIVSGWYEYADGKLTGTLEGSVLKGWWSESDDTKECGPGNAWSGPAVLRFGADGKSFKGQYGKCARGERTHESLKPDAKWDGTLAKGAIDLGGGPMARVPEAMPPPMAPPASRLTSDWQTDYNVMHLTQEGNAVSGTYEYKGGQVTGTLEGTVLKGWWRQTTDSSNVCGPGNQWAGPIVFRFAPDGRSFQGLWGGCQETHDNLSANRKWNGTLKKGGIALGAPSAVPPVAAQPPTAPRAPSRQMSDWSTDFNAMHLAQEGAVVTGTYEHAGGQVTGTLEGTTLKGWWSQTNHSKQCGPGNQWSGPLVFQFSADGKSFRGQWGGCSDKHENLPAGSKWNGTLTKGMIDLRGGGAQAPRITEDALAGLSRESLEEIASGAPEDLESILGGGPLYMGAPAEATPELKGFYQARLARVEELLALMDQAEGAVNKTLDALRPLRKHLLSFYGGLFAKLQQDGQGARAREPTPGGGQDRENMQAYLWAIMDRLGDDMALTQAEAVHLRAASQALRGATNIPRNAKLSMLAYHRYSLLHKALSRLSGEITRHGVQAAAVVLLLESDAGMVPGVRPVIRDFEYDMGPLLQQAFGASQAAVSGFQQITLGFRSLQAGDYAFMQHTLGQMETALPHISRQAAALAPGGPVTGEDVAFIRGYAAYLEGLVGAFRTKFPRANPAELGWSDPPPGFPAWQALASLSDARVVLAARMGEGIVRPIPVSGEAGSTWYGKASQALAWPLMGAVALGQKGLEAAASPWQTAKETVQNAQRAVGSAVDAANMAVGAAMDVAANAYYGNSLKDTKDIIAGNMNSMVESWKKGEMGSTVLKETKGVLDSLDNTVQSVAGGAVEKAIGKGNISWGVGMLAKIGAGAVTGLGKGVALLSNPASSPGEMAEGALEVALSFSGGGKTLLNVGERVGGSVAGEVVAKTGQELLKQGEKLAAKSVASVHQGAIKSILTKGGAMTVEQISLLKTHVMKKVAKEAEAKAIQQTEKGIAQLLGESLQESKSFAKELQGEVLDAAAGAFKKYEFGLAGLREAAKNVFGKSPGEVLGKTLFAGYWEDYFKAGTKDLIEGKVGGPGVNAEELAQATAEAGRQFGIDPAKLAQAQQWNQAYRDALKSGKSPADARALADARLKGGVSPASVPPPSVAPSPAPVSPPGTTPRHGALAGTFQGESTEGSLQFTISGNALSGAARGRFKDAAFAGSLQGLYNRESGAISLYLTGKWKIVGKPCEGESCSGELGGMFSGARSGAGFSGKWHGKGALGDSGTWNAARGGTRPPTKKEESGR